MNFIERLFSFSPDAGNGSTEATVLVVVMIAIVLWVTLRSRQRFRNRRESLAHRGTV